MARSTLTVRGSSLETLFSSLSAIKRDLEAADGSAVEAADACGHEALAQRVRSFSTEWNDVRRGLAESLADLGRSAGALSDAFTDVENRLAGQLAGEG
jgi:hypothetical protein